VKCILHSTASSYRKIDLHDEYTGYDTVPEILPRTLIVMEHLSTADVETLLRFAQVSCMEEVL